MRTPRLEYIGAATQGMPQPPVDAWYQGRRFLVFIVTFLVCLVAGLGYVYSRPAVYRASATLLTTSAPAADVQTFQTDNQHVMLQVRHLLNQSLLEGVLTKLNTAVDGTPMDYAAFRAMLSVEPVPDTYLVRLAAEGANPIYLEMAVDTWVNTYLDERAREVEQNSDTTVQALQEQSQSLQQQVEQKREALRVFREEHGILSHGRDENRVVGKLKGLSKSADKANDRVVDARARLESLQQSIEAGKLVVPKEDRRELMTLIRRAESMRSRLETARSRFTDDYINLDPKLHSLADELAEAEREISERKSIGQQIMTAEAEQELEEALRTVDSIQEQMNELNAQAAEFSARFAEHETMQEDLKELELLNRQAEARVAAIQSENRQKYPQVEVIDPVFVDPQPVAPNFGRDASLALAIALGAALFVTLLVEYLLSEQRSGPAANLTGIKVYVDGGDRPPALDRQAPYKALPPDQ